MPKRKMHGLSKTPEYAIWGTMIARCHNPNSVGFPHYGARGIAVCDRWRQSFVAFLDDVGPRPSREYSLERLDNTKGYEPGNVRWATDIEQANNTRRSRFVTYNGETLTLSQWSRRLGIPRPVLHKRIYTRGWSVEKAFSAENGADETRITHNGETLSIAEWARRTGIGDGTIQFRLSHGWSPEPALTQRENASARAIEYRGERLSIAAWARRVGLKQHTIAHRLRNGWSVERALTTPVR